MKIFNLAVRSILSLPSWHEISENNSLSLHFIGPFMILFMFIFSFDGLLIKSDKIIELIA